MKNARMNISRFRFLIFNLKILSAITEIVSPFWSRSFSVAFSDFEMT